MNKFTALKELNDELEGMIMKATKFNELENYIKLKMIVNSIVDNEILEEEQKQMTKMIDIIFGGKR